MANLFAEQQALLSKTRAQLQAAAARLAAVLVLGTAVVTALVLVDGRLSSRAAVTIREAAIAEEQNRGLTVEAEEALRRAQLGELLSATRDRRERWAQVLAAIAPATPRSVFLTRLILKEDEGREVLSINGYATGIEVLPGFLEDVGRAVGAEATRIDNASDVQVDGKAMVRFSCQAYLRKLTRNGSPRNSQDGNSDRQS
jgi:hypothetical protein